MIALEATANNELLRQSFLKSFCKDQYFQMTVQGLGTAVWHLNGLAKMTGDVLLRSAWRRVRGILMQWYCRLGLPPASNQDVPPLEGPKMYCRL